MYKPILLVFIVFLTGCALQQPIILNGFEEEFQIEISKCDLKNTKEEIVECRDNILLQQAMNLDDNTYCDYSSTTTITKFCYSLFYLEKAQTTQQSSFCKFIQHELIKETCLISIDNPKNI